MKVKWQWFLGGRIMFWVSIMMLIGLTISFTLTYIIDPTKKIYMKEQGLDPTSIKEYSEKYVECFGIKVDKPVVYKFVKYNVKNNPNKDVLLGTFHEWNDTYYINISIDLFKTSILHETVIHETRHMLVEYLKDKDIIDLTKYTEEIAQGENEKYNTLFNSGMSLLKEKEQDKK